MEIEKLPLGVAQRGVPRGGAAHDTVLRGFAVDVTHFDLEEGHLGVGVVPDAHLEPGSFAPDVLPNTNVVGRVEVEFAVRRGHGVGNGQHRVVLQLGQGVTQPMFRHQELRIETVHQGHRFDVFQPQVGSSVQQGQEVHAGVAKVRCAPRRRVGRPKVECVFCTRYESRFGPCPPSGAQVRLRAIFGHIQIVDGYISTHHRCSAQKACKSARKGRFSEVVFAAFTRHLHTLVP